VIYKALFESRTSTWQAFGRVVFFESQDDDPIEHQRIAIVEAQKEYPGTEIRIASVSASSQAAWDAFNEQRRRYAEWLKRSVTGEPNRRADLESGRPAEPTEGGTVKESEAEAIRLLALALKATASVFRNCAPEMPDVCDQIAEFLEHPDQAKAQLRGEEERLAKMHRIR
jgi:hypothetical protein